MLLVLEQQPNQPGQIASKQRLSAGQPHLVDAEIRKIARQSAAISSKVSTSSRGSQT